MALRDAAFHRSHCPLDLAPLPAVRLAEHGQQDDATACCNVIRDADLLTSEMETQLAQLPRELARVWLAKMNTMLLEQIDVGVRDSAVGVAEPGVPLVELRLRLDLALYHSNYAIPARILVKGIAVRWPAAAGPVASRRVYFRHPATVESPHRGERRCSLAFCMS